MGRESRLKRHSRDNHRAEQTRPDWPRYAVAKRKSIDELVKATVAHEAGHIVTALALDLEVNYAIIHVLVSEHEREIGGYTELTYGRLEDFGTREAAMNAL